ncbi:transferase family hexapeptide repeat protein [Motilibacter peucedani]|uniref:Transferase family hexapeptide repeat protein n=1 Tax=Motilibacter peucedani TaxID=598650 RepID=A0A420XTJ9_9ACTN|nr:hypothetical protein [Motilibacter peucedani]RKS80165.1 transferase family hexapeptide repeat protein [Motilibacter peucedani]
MKLTVVLLADQTPPATASAVWATVEAANAVEDALGVEVDARLVAVGPDPETEPLLRSVEGAVVDVAPGEGLATAWDRGVAATTAELVYLCTDVSAPRPDALVELVRALLAHPEAVVAFPGTSAAPAVLARSSYLRGVGGLQGLGLAWPDAAPEVWHHLWLLLEPGRRVVVPGAVVRGVPVVQPPRPLDPAGWVTVGAHTYLAGDSKAVAYVSTQRIRIGAYCSIAEGVRLLNPHPRDGRVVGADGVETTLNLFGVHRPGTATTFPLNRLGYVEPEWPRPDQLGAPQVIGNDVWIGQGAVVVGPVTVGDGAIVGAGAVVSRDVPPYAVVAGNPAQVVRYRYDQGVIDAMLEIRWWDWTEEVISERLEWFRRPAAEFVAQFGPAGRSASTAAVGRPTPLFRDPVFDGATDPVLVRNRAEGTWWLVYTARRASVPTAGVEWVHGSDLGVAISADGGASWTYRGTLAGLEHEPGRNTFWAPELLWVGDTCHMFVSYVRGVPDRWEGHARHIHHYTSSDMWAWEHQGRLELSSDRVIDAAVVALPGGGYRMYYKDEADGGTTWSSDSADLSSWSGHRRVLQTMGGHEGPKVFFFEGAWWLLVDGWKGQLAYRSDDLESWEEAGRILEPATGRPGTDDVGAGHHADLVVDGSRAYVVYFTHPERHTAASDLPRARRSSVHVAELHVVDGRLTAARGEPDVLRLSDDAV